MKIVLATGNPHKREEMAWILADLGLPLAIVDPPAPLPPVVEDGGTLAENAAKKALTVARALAMPALADDTGLEIAALGGAPGIRAARWAGPRCIAEENVAKALGELQGRPEAERGAVFRCVVALCVDPEKELLYGEGRLEGRIAEAPSGGGGFGYDPVFHLPERGCTLAELAGEEKNRLSHRYRALAALGRLLDPR